MEVRVRYAPSPTGLQHIGGVRTALFNYLFARASGGKFILCVEDTDRTRSTAEYVNNLYDTLSWLGITWDEGPVVGGPDGPYVQSERAALFREYAEKLVATGAAYRCFCTSERLERLREERAASKSGAGYDRRCRSLDPAETERLCAEGAKFVIRLKMPLEGMTAFDDRLLGKIEWKNEDVNPDPVLLKSDGFPTYHLANVVDDHLMRISHVMRAQEWIPSTPIHIMMYESFGWEHPEYCHLPMVLGQDGQKLSKRHGSTSVNEFRALGYLPDALVNYVALLGCSFEEGRDLYSLADLAAAFRIEKLNKASAVFDYKKLEWYNGQYIRMKNDEELVGLCAPYLAKAGLIGDPPGALERDKLGLAIPLVKERLSLLGQVGDSLKFLFSDIPAPSPDDLVPKKLDAAKTAAILVALREMLAELAAPDEQMVEARVRGLAESFGVKLGDFLMPLRVALTGARVSPPLFGSLRVLGVDTARRRIDRAIAALAGHAGS